MKNMLIAAALAVASTSAFAGGFVELDHYSMVNELDYGLTMVSAGYDHSLTDRLSIAGRIGTPVSEYNDFERANGNNLEVGDVIVGLNVRYQVYKGLFGEVDHVSEADEFDYGLTLVNVGLTHNFTDRFSVTGKIGTPVSEYNDFKTANGNDLARGDVVGGLGARFRF